MSLSSTLSSKVPILLAPILVLIALVLGPSIVQSQNEPDTCIPGYVWREAFPNDHVCVIPETRQQAADDNAQANTRIDPSGPYGPDTCVRGYVWREVSPTDHVCVTPQTRQQVAEDNRQAQRRRVRRLRGPLPIQTSTTQEVQPRIPLSRQSPSPPIQPTPCDVVTMGEISEDGSVAVEIRHPDGVIERKTEAGTTTIYPDGRTEFRPRQVIFVQVQPPNPPMLSNDPELLQKWREFHAESLLGIFRSLSKNDEEANKRLTDTEANMTLYEKINHRTKIIQSFLAKQQ